MIGRFAACYRRAPDRSWWLVYALLAALFWAPLLAGLRTLYFDDTFHYYYPIRAIGFASLRAGLLPLWTPLLQAGYPLLAEGQMGGLYPPQFLFWLLPPHLALSWTVALHTWLAAFFVHGYLRCLGVRPASAAVGAVGFMFSGAFIGHLVYLPMAFSLVWLPAACWGLESAYRRRRFRGFVAAAVALAMALTAVHAQMAAYVGLTAAAYALMRLSSLPGQRGWGLAGLLTMLGGAGWLAAGQLLPLAELLGQTERGAGLNWGLLLEYGLSPQWVLFLFLPRFFGHPTSPPLHWAGLTVPWELNAFCGVIVALLALLAPFLVRRRVVWPLTLIWWGTFLLAWGRATPLFELLHSLPVMGAFRIPARWLIPGAFAGCALAGLALDAVRRDPAWATARLKRLLPVAILPMVTILGLAWLALSVATVDPWHHRMAIAAMLWFALTWYTATFLLVGAAGKTWLAPVLVAWLAVELFAAQRTFNPTLPPSVFSAAAEPLTDLAAVELGATLDGERVFLPPYVPKHPFLEPSSNALAGIPSIENFAPLRLARVDTLLNSWKDELEPRGSGDRVERWLQAARQASVESSPGAAAERLLWLRRWRVRWTLPRYGPPGARPDARGLHRLPGELAPQAWQPVSVRAAAAADLRSRLTQAGAPALETSWITGSPPPRAISPGPLEYRALTPQREVLEPRGSGLVVVNGTAYPGWRGYDAAGRRLEMVVVDSLFRAAILRSPTARVTFVFEPFSVKLGAFLSLLALAGLVLLGMNRCD